MYKIEKQPYGFKLTFSGVITATEMTQWVKESETTLSGHVGKFGIMVDMRDLKPLAPDVAIIMQGGQKLYKEKGMDKSVVILANSVVTMQFKRIAKESGITAWERYIDASSVKDWGKVGIAWIKDGIDPDKK
jgi:hypothetical protein